MPKNKKTQIKEREPVHIEATTPKADDKLAPHLVYATIEFEVQAEDEDGAEEKGRAILNEMMANYKENHLRVKDAKLADKLTGYFFRK